MLVAVLSEPSCALDGCSPPCGLTDWIALGGLCHPTTCHHRLRQRTLHRKSISQHRLGNPSLFTGLSLFTSCSRSFFSSHSLSHTASACADARIHRLLIVHLVCLPLRQPSQPDCFIVCPQPQASQLAFIRLSCRNWVYQGAQARCKDKHRQGHIHRHPHPPGPDTSQNTGSEGGAQVSKEVGSLVGAVQLHLHMRLVPFLVCHHRGCPP